MQVICDKCGWSYDTNENGHCPRCLHTGHDAAVVRGPYVSAHHGGGINCATCGNPYSPASPVCPVCESRNGQTANRISNVDDEIETWMELSQKWGGERVGVMHDCLDKMVDGRGILLVNVWKPIDVDRVLRAVFHEE